MQKMLQEQQTVIKMALARILPSRQQQSSGYFCQVNKTS